jgi:trigger factor
MAARPRGFCLVKIHTQSHDLRHRVNKLNIQVEHLEDHTARLTVSVEGERVQKQMQSAARRLSQKLNIPGFRKGKAPFNIVLRYVGQAALMEEAIEQIANELYPKAVDEAKIDPYGTGSLEEIKPGAAEDAPLELVFIVAKQAACELPADYRAIRLPYEASEVPDSQVETAIQNMLESKAVLEAVERPAQTDDVVKIKLLGRLFEPNEEGAEPESPEGEMIADENEMQVVLSPEKRVEYMPGFNMQLVGLSKNDEKKITLEFPADHESTELAGNRYEFDVTVVEVQSRTLPALDDDFAKEISNGEAETVETMRKQLYDRLQSTAKREADSAYSDKMLDAITKASAVHYPEKMVEEYTTDILNTLDENLRNQGLSLAMLMKMQNKSEEDLRSEYRDTAIERLKRSVVLRDLVVAEKLAITDVDLNARIDALVTQFSPDPTQRESFRRMFNNEDTLRRIAYDMVMGRMSERLIAIGKGEPIAEPEAAATPQEEIKPAE